jgi:hypothetical protein
MQHTHSLWPYCAVLCSAASPAAAAGNKRLGEADDELVGQKDHFREAHGSLGTLKRQAMIDRCAVLGSRIKQEQRLRG